MSTNLSPITSSYLDYLPAVFHEDPFFGQFLLAFEAILGDSVSAEASPEELKKDQNKTEGFDHILDRIHTYVSPQDTPEDFLPWLAGWVALSLRDDWEDKVKRDFIQQIIPLYRQRGTKLGLKTLLQIYLQKQTVQSQIEYVKIFEFDAIPHYFQVQLRLDTQDLKEFRRKETVARAIIDQEKPAHTTYALQILMPTMRLVSAQKLRAEANDQNQTITEREINQKRLRLFVGRAHPDFQTHQNRTILGTVVGQSRKNRAEPP